MAYFFWKLFLKINGWNSDITFPKNIKKAVVIVAPHTSWWDFIFGLAYRSISKIKHTHFLGKAELFKWPFGWFFYWLGGTPVDRKSKQNIVEQITKEFNAHEHFLLALAPEGTRKKVTQLKTGFYYIAKSADVPIVMAAMDYKKKTLIYAEPFFTSENEAEDFKKIIAFFAPIQGKNPELGLAHLL